MERNLPHLFAQKKASTHQPLGVRVRALSAGTVLGLVLSCLRSLAHALARKDESKQQNIERYKVKAESAQAFCDIQMILERAWVFTASPRRRLFSTGALTPRIRREIVACGGKISLDCRHQAKERRPST